MIVLFILGLIITSSFSASVVVITSAAVVVAAACLPSATYFLTSIVFSFFVKMSFSIKLLLIATKKEKKV